MYCPKCGKEIPEGSQFCLHCGGVLSRKASVSAVTGFSLAAVAIIIVFALIVGGVIVVYVYNEESKRNVETPSQPSPVITQNNPARQPERVSLIDKTFPVAAQKYVYYTIPLRVITHITGHFTAQGGSNDIEVLLMDQDGFTNFSNGHNASTYYNSGGYVTTGSIDLNLRPGTYYAVFNNAQAMLTNKVVTAKIDAEF